MFSFVFQSLISSMHGDEDVIPPSDDEVIPPYLHRMPRSYRQWMPRSYPIPPSDAKVILLEAFVLPLEAFIHLTQYGTLKMIDLFVLTTAFTSD